MMNKVSILRSLSQTLLPASLIAMLVLIAGCGASFNNNESNGSSSPAATPTVSIIANPTSINAGGSSTLTVNATNATRVTVKGTDGSAYTLSAAGVRRRSAQLRLQPTPRPARLGLGAAPQRWRR